MQQTHEINSTSGWSKAGQGDRGNRTPRHKGRNVGFCEQLRASVMGLAFGEEQNSNDGFTIRCNGMINRK